MRFGLTLLTDVPWSEAAPAVGGRRGVGFDHAWTFDHLVWGGLPDSAVGSVAVPTLAARCRSVTSRIGLGTLVASPNFRHPYPFFR